MANQLDIHERLLEGCRNRDPTAHRRLYDLYSKAMYNVSLRIVGTREDAEDVLQESFISAFDRIDSFRQESSFGGWLKRIVINRSLNHIRGRIYFKEVDEEILMIAPEREESRSEEYDLSDIQLAMRQLPDGFRTVFSLFMFEDYGHREIAELLGVTEGTSKSQLNRAKKKLKELMIEERHAQRRV